MYRKLRNRISRHLVLQASCFILLPGIYFISSCNEPEETTPSQDTSFKLTSPAIGTDSLLPAEFTCDGNSSTLPLTWSGYPANTKYFALIMHHEASPNDIHWYWVLYNIPAAFTSLPKNVEGIGTLGNNSVNDRIEYAPPCSQGPGKKYYILTVYALSERVEIAVPPEEVNRDVLLEAMNGITLSSAYMTVWYSRNIKSSSN